MRYTATGAPLLILLLVTACGAGGSGQEASVLSDPEGYSVTVPPGWEVAEHFREGSFIRADITDGGDMGMQIRLADVSPGGFYANAESMIADYAEDMSAHHGGNCTETGREAPAAGDEALTARFLAEHSSGNRWYLQLSLVRSDDMLVIFQCGCIWEDRQQGRATFDRTVESISFHR